MKVYIKIEKKQLYDLIILKSIRNKDISKIAVAINISMATKML